MEATELKLELAKVSKLPFVRNTFGLFVCSQLLVLILVLFIVGILELDHSNKTSYVDGPFACSYFVGGLCAVVVGAMTIGIEYRDEVKQRNQRDTCAYLSKLFTAVVLVVICFAIVSLVIFTIYTFLIFPSSTTGLTLGDLLQYTLRLIIWLTGLTVLAFGLTALVRSSVVGIVFVLVWVYFIDTALRGFDVVSRFTFSVSLIRVAAVVPFPKEKIVQHDILLWQGLVQLAIYCGITLTAGWACYLRGS